jgi:PhoPQ-activated pathogenicity-related protein
VPNAGHDLREADKDGKKELLPLRAVNTLSAFCYCQIFDKPMPTLGWKYADADGAVRGEVSHDGRVTVQRQWTAVAKTRDFRAARWASAEHFKFPPPGNVLTGVNAKLILQPPATGFRADFVEAEFTLDGRSFTLSTQLRILEAKK